MRIIILTLIVVIIFYQCIFSIDKKKENDKENSAVKNRYELFDDFKMLDEPGFFDVEFTPRRTKALIFSTLIPGSGQTFLGDEIKGMGISLAFYGTALAAVIAHNNSQGREDRIRVLTQDYNSKGNYNDAEKVWQTILAEKTNRDNDYDRRTIFTWLAVGVWVYNIFDILFLTNDQGENEFSQNNRVIDLNLAAYNDFKGVALKLNLP